MTEAINKADVAAKDAVRVVKDLEDMHRGEMAEARAKMIMLANSRDVLTGRRRTLQRSATDTLRRTADPELVAEIDQCKRQLERAQSGEGTIPDRRASIEDRQAELERQRAVVAQLNNRIAELQASQLDPDAFAL